MSVFRPLNSDESNLFTIRITLDLTSEPSASQIIAGGSSQTIALDKMTAPTQNNLPGYFGIYYNQTASSKAFHIMYGKEFTSQPCISVIPHVGTLVGSTPGDNLTPVPVIKYNNKDKYTEAVTATAYNVGLAFRNSAGTEQTVYGTGGLLGFDLVITGPIKVGVTTGNSNKGWSIGSGNDPNTVYSYLNVGINTGNPTIPLAINGSAAFRKNVIALTNSATNTRTLKEIESGSLITVSPSTNTATTVQVTLPQTNDVSTSATASVGTFFKIIFLANAANAGADIVISSGNDSVDITGTVVTKEDSNENVTALTSCSKFTFDATSDVNINNASIELVCITTTLWHATITYPGTTAANIVGTTAGTSKIVTSATA
jgi:hypothetical protein